MSIVTGTGDDGYSSLFGGKRVPKNHPRLEAYGVVDEAQSAIGMVRSLGGLPDDIENLLKLVQKDLFVLGSDLASPDPDNRIPRVTKDMIQFIENECHNIENSLPELKNFIMPTGTLAASMCFWARAVVRRAEREVTDILNEGGHVNYPLIYLNRLSDLLFLIARKLNEVGGIGEEIWDV